MCNASKPKPCCVDSAMDHEKNKEEGFGYSFSVLLELAACDDLDGFRTSVEEEGRDVDEVGYWYGRRVGSRKMGVEERTPLMIAAMFGSVDVVGYIIETCRVDVNRVCGKDIATALHCAVAGGSGGSVEVVRVLLSASADVGCVDVNGNQAGDLIAGSYSSAFNSRKKALEVMLKGESGLDEAFDFSEQICREAGGEDQQEITTPRASKDGTERKEYPVDLSLPDIKNGIYSTDEFRMYTFKVKPCSRAYSHDWTECPFVHPGENARRRDPRKYHYSCVPCPEFRKGTCRQGDACDYAHGIFECWLHPAQYRTRLCKDETGCTRRVCFFAHKTEELRPLYASTGSAVLSPRSYAAGASLDMGSMSPFSLNSPSVMIPSVSTPPMTPTGPSSPGNGNIWQNQPNIAPPTLQLPGSRLKSTLSARDMDLDLELLSLENHRRRQRFIEELSSPSSNWNNGLSSPSAFSASGNRIGEMNRIGGFRPTNLEDAFGSMDHTMLPQLQGLPRDTTSSQLQSPTGIQMRQNMNMQLRSSYSGSPSSSPVRGSLLHGFDSFDSSDAAAILSSRAAAFAKQRSQSFVERGAANQNYGFPSAVDPVTPKHSKLSNWGSPNGKLDWCIQGEELNKMRKSASFGPRNNGNSFPNVDEPDVTWVNTLVKDAPPPSRPAPLGFEEQQQQCHVTHVDNGDSEILSAWVEQLYLEHEQMVA